MVSASQASRLDDKFLSEQLNEVRQYLEVSFTLYLTVGFSSKHVEAIKITEANILSWPSQSPLLKPLGLQPEASRPGGVQAGDVVYLAKRKKIPEVRMLAVM